MSLFSFGVRVVLASKNVFGSVPSSSVFWKSLRRIGIYSLLVEFACEIYGYCTLDCKEFFNYRFYFLCSNLVCSNYLSLTDSILVGHM